MIVCHCLGATDRDIRRALEGGRCTPADIGRACGAGACCGGCQEAIGEILREHALAQRREAQPLDRPAA